SLFLHSHAWLSDCLIARLYQSPSDSRPGVLKEPKLMGAIYFFIFFFTLLVFPVPLSSFSSTRRPSGRRQHADLREDPDGQDHHS
ncbi:hypothetical protein, partial [Pseudomonas aeruginosa]